MQDQGPVRDIVAIITDPPGHRGQQQHTGGERGGASLAIAAEQSYSLERPGANHDSSEGGHMSPLATLLLASTAQERSDRPAS